MLISIDTEFDRRHTYRPILSIVQIKEEGKQPVIYDVKRTGNGDKDVNNNIQCCGDIKSSEEDLKYLVDLLSNKDNIKIIHASSQDIEAIYSHFKFVIKNVFDTQIGAKYLGFGYEIGYAKAVELFCDKEIVKEKRLQNSHWLKRPLTKEQIFYAKQDVEFLEHIYNKMNLLFKDKPEEYEKFCNECNNLVSEKKYKFNPYYVWQKNKHKIKFTKNYELIKKLFFEREKQASYHNLSREFVWKLKDLVMFAETKDKMFLQSINFRVPQDVFLRYI